MIKFFRKIRQKLLTENKFSKYLIYAIGEIILVVIGILIALQINNWNEDKTRSNRERDYLMALKSDFKQTKSDFDINKSEHLIVKSAMERILDWAEFGSVPDSDIIKFDSLLGNIFWMSSFDPPVGTIETILASGNVDLIKNEKLVSLLTQWTSLVENYRSEEMRAIDHFYQSIYPFLSKKVNLQDMDKSIPKKLPWAHDLTQAYLLVTNQEFHNLVYVHWVIQWNLDEFHAPKLDNAIQMILELVESEINNKQS